MDSPNKFSTIVSVREVEISVQFRKRSLLTGLPECAFCGCLSSVLNTFRRCSLHIFWKTFSCFTLSLMWVVSLNAANIALRSALMALRFLSFNAATLSAINCSCCHSPIVKTAAKGRIIAKRRFFIVKNRLPRVKKLARNIFKPLFRDIPAVSKNNKTVCQMPISFCSFRCFPAIYNVSKSINIDKMKWSGAILESKT